MALDKVSLKKGIVSLLTSLAGYDGEGEQEQSKAIEKFASDLSAAIDTYVKSGDVSTTVTGSCPQGAVTGTGKGKIS